MDVQQQLLGRHGNKISHQLEKKIKYQTKLNSAFIYFEVFFSSMGYDNEDSSLT